MSLRNVRFLKSSVLAVVAALGCTGSLGCQQLLQDLGGGASTGDASTNTTGPVCVNGGNGADGLECCQEEGAACGGDYDCCGGLCSGDGVDGTGTCVSSGNTSCVAALGSRCKTVESCACATSDDCCQEGTGAVCTSSPVTTVGKRCCLQTGIPCGGDGDCCSGSCDPTQLTCD
jgi:hypothetical protein